VGGLGINRLHSWWEKFLLGSPTGIDLPGEADGFLPTPAWKEKKTGAPWLLGDTYNVSIGQGDLLVTPIQLLNYISAIANGGKIYKPMVNLEREHPKLLADLSELLPEILEVRKGMEEAVASPLGTAHLLSDLGFKVAAKTGTSEVRSKQDENAFFVGYAPAGNPQIAILVLVEHSLEGSLNTVPIAKDVLNWYYWQRVHK
jgi:penicillin-binding protein 2